MAIIAQKELDLWGEIESTPELERIRGVLEVLPDEELVRELEDERGRGRMIIL